MSLNEQYSLFALHIAQLILHAHEHGFQAYIKEWSDLGARLNLIATDGQEEEAPESYRFLCDFWESLSPRNKSGINHRDPQPHYFERLKA